ncbi:NnrS family protein [Pseudorhodoferax sp.]|uniref:NnrS family protein n=1 Tax=Pseudorhodoferax sp. TaxID=1993553 RepID=UPI002DD66A3E|nr:NnrS family protein [Pseudorhodoferax sp.]
MSTLFTIEEPPRPPARRLALWELGFRPFYLLASSFAALSILLWALQFAGLLGWPAYLAGGLWHAHEMVFGFALAVIVGFLFTAGRNWSNQPTPTGWALAALALLWLAARVLVLTPWAWAAALANVAFPLAAAAGLGRALVRGGNRRNYFFVGLLALLALAAALLHANRLGLIALPAHIGLQVALDVVLFIVVVMAGRVLPMFTNNGVPGAAATRKEPLEKACLGLVLALLAVDAVGLAGPLLAVIAAAAAMAHALRWWLWQPWKTLRTPLVWVLHAAYLWVPVHLALRAAAVPGWASPSVAVHALTVGAIGGLIIGMMTRTARGHTARPLRADGFDVACYVLVLAAALVRVLLPWGLPALTLQAVLASALLWSAGFALYALRYAPFLLWPRLDGRPG